MAHLDANWHLALNAAAVDGMTHGRDILFTYGPLGYLFVPTPPYRLHFAIHLVVFLTTWTGIAYWLIRRLMRRGWNRTMALLTVYVLLLGRGATFVPEAIAIVLVALALSSIADRPANQRNIGAGLGVLGGVLFLAKPSVGLLVSFAGAVVGLHAQPRVGSVIRSLLVPLATVLVGWSALGQQPAALGDWLVGSWHVAIAYGGMAIDHPESGAHYALACLFLALLAVVIARESGFRSPSTWFLVLAAVSVAFMTKYGFTRHDSEHAAALFWSLGLLLVVFAAHSMAKAATVAALITMLLFITPLDATGSGPLDGPDAFWREVRLALAPQAAASLAASRLEEASGVLEPATELMGQVGDGGVHVDSYFTGIVANSWRTWAPVPVFHSYVATTRALDRLNAETLAAHDDLRFVLLDRSPAIDNRFRRFEQPLYQLQLLCNMNRVDSRASWELLVRRGSNRCSPPRTTEQVRIMPGEVAEVPEASPGEAVVASVDLRPRVVERVLSTMLKPAPPVSVELDGKRYRFVSGTTPGPYLLRVPSGEGIPFSGVATEAISFSGLVGPIDVTFQRIALK